MKTILVAIFFFLLGFLSFYLLDTSEKEAKQLLNKTEVANDEVINIKNLEQREIEDSSDEITQQARAYYQKAFKLFLATLNVKMNKEQVKSFNRLVKDPKEYMSQTDQTEVFVNEYISLEKLGPQQFHLGHINDDELIAKLKNNILSQAKVYYAKSESLDSYEIMKSINGTYRGELFRITEKKDRKDMIYLEIEFLPGATEKLNGQYQMSLSHRGEVYSNKSGNGNNDSIRLKDDRLIIDAGPSAFFHFTDLSVGMANYYVDGNLIGFAHFYRD